MPVQDRNKACLLPKASALSLQERDGAMINLICQIGTAAKIRYLVNRYLGVCVRVIWDEMSIEVSGL